MNTSIKIRSQKCESDDKNWIITKSSCSADHKETDGMSAQRWGWTGTGIGTTVPSTQVLSSLVTVSTTISSALPRDRLFICDQLNSCL